MKYLSAIWSLVSGAGTMVSGASLVTKILIGLGVGATLLTAYGIWHHEVYQSGVNDTLAKIAREDQQTIARGLEMRDKWKSCRALNRSWDQNTGSCT